MVKRESGKEGKKEGKITVDLKGIDLRHAIELRQKQELEIGAVVSVAEVVREAIHEKYVREIEKETMEQ